MDTITSVVNTPSEEILTVTEAEGLYLPIIANADVDFGVYDLTSNGLYPNFIQFDTAATPIASAAGLMQWNDTDETLDLGMPDGITLQIGQDTQIKVRNNTGSTILNGKAVYVNGVLGNRPTIALAQGNSHLAGHVIGVTTQDITNNDDGKVTTEGYVRNINATGSPYGETWAEGDTLWLSKTTAGALTNIEPTEPHHSAEIGIVTRSHATQGSILVNITQHQTLEHLSDVNGTALTTTGQIPVWDNTAGYFDFNYNLTDYWKNDGSSTATGDWDLGAYGIKVGDGTVLSIDSIDRKLYEPDGTTVAIDWSGTTYPFGVFINSAYIDSIFPTGTLVSIGSAGDADLTAKDFYATGIYYIGANAGFTGTGTYTNFTIEGGIITNAT